MVPRAEGQGFPCDSLLYFMRPVPECLSHEPLLFFGGGPKWRDDVGRRTATKTVG